MLDQEKSAVLSPDTMLVTLAKLLCETCDGETAEVKEAEEVQLQAECLLHSDGCRHILFTHIKDQ